MSTSTPEQIDQLRDRIAEVIEPWFNYFAPGPDPQPTHRERLVGAANAVMELFPHVESIRERQTAVVEAVGPEACPCGRPRDPRDTRCCDACRVGRHSRKCAARAGAEPVRKEAP